MHGFFSIGLLVSYRFMFFFYRLETSAPGLSGYYWYIGQVTAHENHAASEREENKKHHQSIQTLLHIQSDSGCCDSAGKTVKFVELSR